MDKIPTLNWAVAEVIYTLREKAGLHQDQLAGLAGLSRNYLSDMERGRQAGSLTAMAHIATALQMDLAQLVGEIEHVWRNDPKPPERKPGNPGKKSKEKKAKS